MRKGKFSSSATAGRDAAESPTDSLPSQDQETPQMTLAAIFKVVSASLNKHYELLGVEELDRKLKAAESITVVDCRMPEAYEESHIEGAINFPLTIFEKNYHVIPKDKPVALVCYLGMFSRVGAKLLVEQGYSTVFSVTGGMKQWDKAYGTRRQSATRCHRPWLCARVSCGSSPRCRGARKS